MWEAIAYVSSGFTLAAFATAAIAWVVKTKSEEKERLISAAEDETKARLVESALEFFHIDTRYLTKQHQYQVAIEQINARANRFKILSILIAFLALVSASLAGYSISVINQVDSNKTSGPVVEPINTPGANTDSGCDLPFDHRPIECNFENGD
jgi:Flp pilus assembly protein TadB